MRPVLLVLVSALVACGSDSSDAGGTPDSGVGGGGLSDHIAGAGSKTYAEKEDSSNACAVTPEDTGYTLDDVGIVISGTIDKADTLGDCFKFKSGPATYAVLRMFVGGVPRELPKLQCAGYSSSIVAPDTGRGPVESNLSCTVGLFPKTGDSGQSYTIELKATK